MAEEVEIMPGPEDRGRTKDNMLSSGCDTAIEVMNTEQLWLPIPVMGGGGVHGIALPADLLATEEFRGVGG